MKQPLDEVELTGYKAKLYKGTKKYTFKNLPLLILATAILGLGIFYFDNPNMFQGDFIHNKFIGMGVLLSVAVSLGSVLLATIIRYVLIRL